MSDIEKSVTTLFIIGLSLCFTAFLVEVSEYKANDKAIYRFKVMLIEKGLAYYSVDSQTGNTQFLWKDDNTVVDFENKDK